MGNLPACPTNKCRAGKLHCPHNPTAVAAETDVEGNEKNTARQLLQQGRYLERGSHELYDGFIIKFFTSVLFNFFK